MWQPELFQKRALRLLLANQVIALVKPQGTKSTKSFFSILNKTLSLPNSWLEFTTHKWKKKELRV